MSKAVKSIAKNFIKQYSLLNPDYEKLEAAAQDLGYTIIEFNNVFNDEDVATIIQNLRITDAVIKSRGFTYADSNYRLIFINEGLNDEEKTIVLAHELGHIVCEHFTSTPIIGRDVREEHEANELAHYLLNPNWTDKVRIFTMRHKKKIIIALSIVVFIIIAVAAVSCIKQEQAYYENYYITSTGNKYHKKECIYVKDKTNVKRLTKEEFETGKYEACDMCLPDK